jgi:SAM-dependent methyltransferase
MGRVMADMCGAMTALLAALGDRAGLFQALAAGPCTSDELAARAGVGERYAREWLRAVACSGYVTYDAAQDRYTLPIEHAVVLAFEQTPLAMGGGFQQLLAFSRALPMLAEALRFGGGVPQEHYGEDLLSGMERMSASWIDHLLVQHWIPAIPELEAKLREGVQVLDVGCGSGRALVCLARAFPRSRFVGVDGFAPALERARARADEAGVADRVKLRQLSVGTDDLGARFDVITAFDSLHDFVDLHAGLVSLREALERDGALLVIERAGSDKPQENFGPLGTILYGTSVFYNLPTSLSNGGAGLGTLGVVEPVLRAACKAAGLNNVTRLPVMQPMSALYLVRP